MTSDPSFTHGLPMDLHVSQGFSYYRYNYSQKKYENNFTFNSPHLISSQNWSRIDFHIHFLCALRAELQESELNLNVYDYESMHHYWVFETLKNFKIIIIKSTFNDVLCRFEHRAWKFIIEKMTYISLTSHYTVYENNSLSIFLIRWLYYIHILLLLSFSRRLWLKSRAEIAKKS